MSSVRGHFFCLDLLYCGGDSPVLVLWKGGSTDA